MTARLTPVPGLGLVARREERVVAVLATDDRANDIVDNWLNSDDPVEGLAGYLGSLAGPVPPLAAMVATGATVTIAAAGGMEVTCTMARGQQRVTAPAGLSHETIADAIYTVTGVPAGTRASVDTRTRLDAGVVAGAGFVYTLSEASDITPTPTHSALVDDSDVTGPHPSITGTTPGGRVISRLPPLDAGSGRPRLYSPPPPAVGPVEAEPPTAENSSPSGRILLIDAPLPALEPLPLADEAPPDGEVSADNVAVVLGVRCSRDHLNDPDAYYCAQCGIAMVHLTHQLSEGRRPSLGFLVFDNGSAYTLDDDYVIGRAPHDDARVDSGEVRPLTIDDRSRTVSRVHADIVLEGWHAHLLDRNSTNGSYLWDEPSASWIRLNPGEPVRLVPGCHASIGQRVFRFESPHEQRL